MNDPAQAHAPKDGMPVGARSESRKIFPGTPATVVVTMSPQACTTSRQVREACEHLHAIRELDKRDAELQLEIQARERERVRNRAAREAHVDGAIEFFEPCAERLDLAERTDRYWRIPQPSEAPNRKRLTDCAILCLDTLADSRQRREHPQARGCLWSLMSCYGGLEAFETRQLGQARTLSFKREHDLFVAEQAAQTECAS